PVVEGGADQAAARDGRAEEVAGPGLRLPERLQQSAEFTARGVAVEEIRRSGVLRARAVVEGCADQEEAVGARGHRRAELLSRRRRRIREGPNESPGLTAEQVGGSRVLPPPSTPGAPTRRLDPAAATENPNS